MNNALRDRSQRRIGTTAVAGAGAFLVVASLATFGSVPAHADTTTTQSFTTQGGHLFTVPAGVTTIHVVAVGASGGGGSGVVNTAPKTGQLPVVSSQGGDGAQVVADLTVTPGENLCAFVNVGGGQGVTDDSNNTSGPGGGETDLRTTPDTSPTCANSTPAMRLLAAGGGGGGPIPFTIFRPGAPKNGLSIETSSAGGHAGWGTATPGNPVAMPQPCAPGAAGTAGGGATTNDQGFGGTCAVGGPPGGPSGAATAGAQATGGNGGNGGGTGGGGGGGAGLFGGGGGASDQSGGGGGGGGASCAPCSISAASTATNTATLDAWHRTAGAVHTTAVLKPGATVVPAGGATPVFTVSSAVPVPATGAAGPVPVWQPALLVTGIVLIGIAGILRRRDGAAH